jgi:hypothetical protein
MLPLKNLWRYLFALIALELAIGGCGGAGSPSPQTAALFANSENSFLPVLSLNGSNPIILNLHDVFQDPGAQAFSMQDGEITSRIVISGSVDTSQAGTYTISYQVTDLEGRAASITRKVIVQSLVPTTPTPTASPSPTSTPKPTPPPIPTPTPTPTPTPSPTPKGSTAPSLTIDPASMSLNLCSTDTSYLFSGVSAAAGDGDALTVNIISLSVNPSRSGTYSIVYFTMNQNGQSATGTRTIFVYQYPSGPFLHCNH